MKKLALVFAAVSIFGIASVSANDKPKKKSSESLTEQIKGFLGNGQYLLEEGELTAEVTLMINGDNELVVLDVDNADKKFESFLKHKLNYKSLEGKNHPQGQVFKLPVRVQS